MLNIVELFSGIGAVRQALTNLGHQHVGFVTADWDIHAIVAYAILHDCPYSDELAVPWLPKKDLISHIISAGLSIDGKRPATRHALNQYTDRALLRILDAHSLSANGGDIRKIKIGSAEVDQIDLLSYTFPCQNISKMASLFGNDSGIDRITENQSNLIWEVEKILYELYKINKLPKILLMENVPNILNRKNKDDFLEWIYELNKYGYVSNYYKLNAKNYGIPQHRNRVYMLSVLVEDDGKRDSVFQYLKSIRPKRIEMPDLQDFLRTDYTNPTYKSEADDACPKYTPYRQKIYTKSKLIDDWFHACFLPTDTITTKQDRMPCAGIIPYKCDLPDKAPFRYLTPRECFLLMGFTETAYDKLLANNFEIAPDKLFFTPSVLYKLAGNSIVVNCLQMLLEPLLKGHTQ